MRLLACLCILGLFVVLQHAAVAKKTSARNAPLARNTGNDKQMDSAEDDELFLLQRRTRPLVSVLFLLSHVTGVFRCLATIGEPHRFALQETSPRIGTTIDDDEQAATLLPSKSLPSIGALVHLYLSLLSHVLLLAKMPDAPFLARLLFYKPCWSSLEDADAVHVRGAIVPLSKLAPSVDIDVDLSCRKGGDGEDVLLAVIPPPTTSSSSSSSASTTTIAAKRSKSSRKKGKVVVRQFVHKNIAHLLVQQSGVGKGGARSKMKKLVLRPRCEGHVVLRYGICEGILASGLSTRQVALRKVLYGTNTLTVPILSIREQLQIKFLSPFALLQQASQFLSILEEHWFQPVMRVLSSVFTETVSLLRDSRATQDLRTASRSSSLASSSAQVLVLRDSVWANATLESLVTGDVIALGEGQVPADCLLVEGQAVCSEASMTGETIPQPKTPMCVPPKSGNDNDNELFSFTKHKGHVLFSGTDVLQATSGAANISTSSRPPLLCLVLRTGFHSSQGELIRKMKEMDSSRGYGTPQQLQDSKRLATLTGTWALVSSLYVWYEGKRQNSKSSFRLLVQITRLVLCCVPPDVQAELMYTVHAALRGMASESRIYCLEPNRLTEAGHVTTCLLDKTGTITFDSLVSDGFVDVHTDLHQKQNTTMEKSPAPLQNGSLTLQLSIMTCHSLVRVAVEKSKDGEGNLAGDPLEMSLVQSLLFRLPSPPMNGSAEELASRVQKQQQQQQQVWRFNESKAFPISLSKRQQHQQNKKKKKQNEDSEGTPFLSCKVLERFPFSSELQRMTVVSDVASKQQSEYLAQAHSTRHGYSSRNTVNSDKKLFVSSKGSPERIFSCLVPEQQLDARFKEAYFKTYLELAGVQGRRVIAVASKIMIAKKKDGKEKMEERRAEHESSLWFEGFICFSCPIRADSETAIRSLLEANINVVMVTGDSCATACHVAASTGIGNSMGETTREDVHRNENELKDVEEKKILRLEFAEDEESLVWKDHKGEVKYLYPSTSTTTTKQREKREEDDDEDEEEEVIVDKGTISMSAKELRVLGDYTLAMEGSIVKHLMRKRQDADLLHCSIFARTEPETKIKLVEAFQSAGESVLMVGDGANDMGALRKANVGIALLNNESPPTIKKEDGDEDKEKEKKESSAEKRARLQHEISTLAATYSKQGRSALSASFKATNEVIAREQKKATASMGLEKGLEKGVEEFGTRIGDASLAAPFTSRKPSLHAAVDVIRFGRAAQAVVIQNTCASVLESFLLGHRFSFLYLKGARLSGRQHMAMALLSSVFSTGQLLVKPLKELSPQKAPRSFFERKYLLSLAKTILVQFSAIHIALRLFSNSADGQNKKLEPNTLSSALFLLSMLVSILTPKVFHVGRPFVHDFHEVPALQVPNSFALWTLPWLTLQILPFFKELHMNSMSAREKALLLLLLAACYTLQTMFRF